MQSTENELLSGKFRYGVQLALQICGDLLGVQAGIPERPEPDNVLLRNDFRPGDRAVGIWNATSPAQVVFTPKHTFVFHLLFIIIFSFYMYKKVVSYMYNELGSSGEKILQQCFGIEFAECMPSIFNAKKYYFEGYVSPKFMLHVANISMGFLYLLTTFISIRNIGKIGSSLDIHIVIGFMYLFVVITIAEIFICRAAKKGIRDRIHQEWDRAHDEIKKMLRQERENADWT